MIKIAFILGFAGSLHCIGMCGPLALMASNQGTKSRILNDIKYHVGKWMSYIILGLVLGIIGQSLHLLKLQNIVSLIAGVLLILLVFVQWKKQTIFHRFAGSVRIQGWSSKIMSHSIQKSPKMASFTIGAINGFIPCGLVYVALTGAISMNHWFDSVLFMTAFSLGTIPALLGLTQGLTQIRSFQKLPLQRIFLLIQLLFGLFLIYKAIYINVPVELDFWIAMKHPILCH